MRMAPTLPLLHFLQVSGFRLQHSAFVRLNIFLDLILPRRKTVFVNTIASDPLDGLAALLDERNLSPAARPPSLRWARLWHFTVPVDSRIRNSCIRERPAATDQAEESARRSNEGGRPRPGEAMRRRPACLCISRISESTNPRIPESPNPRIHLRHPPSRERPRHPDRPGPAGPFQRRDDDDPHPRHAPARSRCPQLVGHGLTHALPTRVIPLFPCAWCHGGAYSSHGSPSPSHTLPGSI